jgi:hypothetical protein
LWMFWAPLRVFFWPLKHIFSFSPSRSRFILLVHFPCHPDSIAFIDIINAPPFQVIAISFQIKITAPHSTDFVFSKVSSESASLVFGSFNAVVFTLQCFILVSLRAERCSCYMLSCDFGSCSLVAVMHISFFHHASIGW